MVNCETYTTTTARDNFAEVIEKAVHRGPVLIKKNNKVKVAVISKELLNLITQIEALLESKEAQEALKEYESSGGITLEKLKKELGM